MLGMRQDGGDGSTNNQAGRDIVIYQGMSYEDTKVMLLELFESNFPVLQQVARDTARQRAEELVADFASRLYEESPESVGALAEPDMQYALVNAEIAYARLGDKEMEEVLVSLLVERAKSQKRSLDFTGNKSPA